MKMLFVIYALVVMLVSTLYNWGSMSAPGSYGGSRSSGSSWSSSSGGSWGGGGGHK